MSTNGARGRNWVAEGLKAIGWMTDPKTPPGKVFARWEKGVSEVMDQLGRNEAYLDAVGKTMTHGFRLQGESIKAMEATLRAMRLPAASDVAALHEDVRRLGDRVDAMSAQLEHVVEILEELRRKPGR